MQMCTQQKRLPFQAFLLLRKIKIIAQDSSWIGPTLISFGQGLVFNHWNKLLNEKENICDLLAYWLHAVIAYIDTDVEIGGEDGKVKEEEKEKIKEEAVEEEEEEKMVTPKKCGDIGTEGKPCGKKKHR